MTTPGLSRIGDQLEIEFRGLPWNGYSPRYLTRFELNRTFAKPAREERYFDEFVTDPAQLNFRLEGGSYGS